MAPAGCRQGEKRAGRVPAHLRHSEPRSFNPRPRAGGDAVDSRRWRLARGPFQSTPPARGATHCSPVRPRSDRDAPARGATRTHEPVPRPQPGFNPRPRAGGDVVPHDGRRAGSTPFQSTPPRGGRLEATRRSNCSWYRRRFNPRPRAGGDPDADRRAASPVSFAVIRHHLL